MKAYFMIIVMSMVGAILGFAIWYIPTVISMKLYYRMIDLIRKVRQQRRSRP